MIALRLSRLELAEERSRLELAKWVSGDPLNVPVCTQPGITQWFVSIFELFK